MADLNDILVQKISPDVGVSCLDVPITVTAIGSCRILGPLRKMATERQMTLNQSGVTGYAHSNAEVLQHLVHLQAGTNPPKHLLPIISPSSSKGQHRSEQHRPSDYYIFELSSAKILTVEGTAVQLNYIKRHFATFFADIDRERAFWTHAKNHNPEQMAQFLNREATYAALDQDDKYILQNLRMEFVSFDQLYHDIIELKRRAPNCLFVTHFDAVDRDNAPLKARKAYLETLRRALDHCAVNWFDPSPLVSKFGQAAALDDQSSSLSHYSEEFEGILANNWWHSYISPAAKALNNERHPTQSKGADTSKNQNNQHLTPSTI